MIQQNACHIITQQVCVCFSREERTDIVHHCEIKLGKDMHEAFDITEVNGTENGPCIWLVYKERLVKMSIY